MRLKIRCDCTGDPPGELMETATVGSLERLNAFSIGPAKEAIASPGRSGVTMPIGPDRRSTGTTGLRSKNSMIRPRALALADSAGHDSRRRAKLKPWAGTFG